MLTLHVRLPRPDHRFGLRQARLDDRDRPVTVGADLAKLPSHQRGAPARSLRQASATRRERQAARNSQDITPFSVRRPTFTTGPVRESGPRGTRRLDADAGLMTTRPRPAQKRRQWKPAVAASLIVPALWGSPSVTAQRPPTEPISIGGGRVVVSSEASVSIAPEDDEWFNYTDYEQSALQQVRLGISTGISLGARLEVLSEIRTEKGNPFEIYAMFLRFRPWLERSFDVQLGRIPPTFGAYARRSYGVANPLIGSPLPYQYLTSLRPDALPETTDDLLRMRARGWRPSYPIGSQTTRPGVPLVSALSWDTGIQARVGDRTTQLVVAVTTGSLSNPLVRDDNAGKQLATRVMFRPLFGLEIGLSGGRADFVDQDVRRTLGAAGEGRFTQSALGADVEYSRDHWIVRGEGLWSAWRLPAIGSPFLDKPLQAWGVTAEAQYKVTPGLYLAARADHLGFSSITGTRFDGAPTSWDLPVTRIEVGGGYSLTRNLIAKLAYQQNWRDDPRDRRTRFVAAQLLYWF